MKRKKKMAVEELAELVAKFAKATDTEFEMALQAVERGGKYVENLEKRIRMLEMQVRVLEEDMYSEEEYSDEL